MPLVREELEKIIQMLEEAKGDCQEEAQEDLRMAIHGLKNVQTALFLKVQLLDRQLNKLAEKGND